MAAQVASCCRARVTADVNCSVAVVSWVGVGIDQEVEGVEIDRGELPAGLTFAERAASLIAWCAQAGGAVGHGRGELAAWAVGGS